MIEETASGWAAIQHDSDQCGDILICKPSPRNRVSHPSQSFADAIQVVNRRLALQRRFRELVAEWYRAYNRFSSDPDEWFMAEPYQKIIALGSEAIPLILKELKNRPNHWFWALYILSDENPVPTESAGNFDEMVQAWLQWGRDRGHV